jgi:glycosyltransferase involved in cell wall biosynthesis
VNPILKVRISPDLAWVPIEYHNKPREMALRALPGRLGALSAFALESYHSIVEERRIAEKAIGFGRRFQADVLWSVLQGQTMIRLAQRISSGLGIKLFTQVLDPPNWWMRHHKVDRFSRDRVLELFEKTLRNSAGCAAASWAMAEKYSRDYGTRTVVCIPSLDKSMALPPARTLRPGNDLIIALAGQIYATDAWRGLITALDSVNWTVCGRDVGIRLLASKSTFHDAIRYTNGRMRIEFLGWNSQSETIRLLAESDILYCPYWFDRNFELEACLSFPAKVTTYLAAGRPVLFHGPHYASPARFLIENKAGLCCHSLEPRTIIDACEQLCSDVDFYQELTKNGRAAFEKYLTISSLRKNFADFLQVEDNVLTPDNQ